MKNNRVIYISHPFTGNEEMNVKESFEIAKKLTERFPNFVFLNPLTALSHDAEICSYELCMKHCLILLARCDAILMTGNWKDSNGCRKEYEFCVLGNIPIFEEEEQLSDFYKLIFKD